MATTGQYEFYPYVLGTDQLDRLGFVNCKDARRNDLTNDIWPALLNWEGIHPDDARLLEPCLRLASHFLNTSSSISFLHAIMYNDRKLLDELSLEYFEELYELPEKGPPSETQSAEFAVGLTEVEDRFHWWLCDPGDPKIVNAWGITSPIREKEEFFTGGLTIRTKSTFGIKLYLRTEMLDILRLLDGGGLGPTTEFELNYELRLQYSTAVTICHEFVHGLNYATSGNLEAFYMNGNFSEFGRVWEQEVFGGTVGFVEDDLNAPLCIVKWPRCNEWDWKYEDEDPARGGTKGSSTFYYIPQRTVAEFARQSTWDNFVPDSVCHIEKTLGIRFMASPNNLDPTWRQSQSSEGMYEANYYGQVWRDESLLETFQNMPSPEPGSETLTGLASVPLLNDSLAGDLQSWSHPEFSSFEGMGYWRPSPSMSSSSLIGLAAVLSLNNDEARDPAVEEDSAQAKEPLLGLAIDLDSDPGHCEESDMTELRQWFEYPAQRSRSSPSPP